MHRGFIAIWRKIEDHVFWKERRQFSKFEAWFDLLKETQWEQEPKQVILGMTILTQYYSETLKSIRTWGKRWGWGEAKVARFLKLLKKMEQIDYKSEGITTRIRVLNYEQYDPRRHINDTTAKQERNTSETGATTNNKVNKVNNTNYKYIVGYLNKKTNQNFNHQTKATRRLIKARFNEGFKLSDFKDVIDFKFQQWGDNEKMVGYLRPQTLFGTKFEAYLQEANKQFKDFSRPLTEEEKWLKKIEKRKNTSNTRT